MSVSSFNFKMGCIGLAQEPFWKASMKLFKEKGLEKGDADPSEFEQVACSHVPQFLKFVKQT